MASETKVTDSNQTQVPADVRRRHAVKPGDVVVWQEQPDGSVRVEFRRKATLDDLVGSVPGAGRGNAVAAKRRAQRGGRA